MGLQDYTFRLKAESGDSTPHDETGAAADLTGGTITLVDLGGGEFTWRFQGRAVTDIANKVESGGSAGNGVTFAIKVAVKHYDGGFTQVASVATADAEQSGLYLGQNGTNNVRARRMGVSNDTVTIGTVGTSIRTHVLRTTTNPLDKVHTWIDTIGRSGDAANVISSGQNYSSNTYSFITAGSNNASANVEISDIVFWPEELSDADCAALADDGIRATLDVGDTTAPVLSSPTGTQTGSTTGSGTVSTDEGNGTLYYWATTNATETAADVKTNGATQAVSGTGSQGVTFSGLSPSTTYYAHYVHRDAAGNDSTRVSSAGFTTTSGASAVAKIIQQMRA